MKTGTSPRVLLGATASLLALAANPAAAQDDADEIIVTGSRIAKSEFTSPDPIQIIDPDTGRMQGQLQLADLLQSVPAAQGSIQITSAISNRFVANGGPDVQTLSLRGLGAERTLVLINGRRAGPAGVRGSVAPFDLNVLPLSVVRRVEVLKTGASSIYGSDAVAGVVNILTRDDLDGFEAGGSSSVPLHGGGESYGADWSFGKRFDRGHVFATVDYFRQANLARRDRGFLDCSEEYLKREADGSRADIVDFRTGRPLCRGTLTNAIVFSGDFTGVDENGFPTFGPGLIAPNGQPIFAGQYGARYAGVGLSLNAYAPLGVFGPDDFFGINFDGPSTGALNEYGAAERGSDVFSRLTRVSAYADAAYALSDATELYGEFLFSNRKSVNQGFQLMRLDQFSGASMLPFFLCDPTRYHCDPFDAGDPYNADFGGNYILQPRITVPAETRTDVDYYRGVLGLRGDLGGWKWDVYGQHSRSDARYAQDIVYQDALDSQSFRTRSCAGTVTRVRGVPCIDIDFTDPRVLAGDFTPAERGFLIGRETGTTLFTQTSAEASLTGDLFTLPAGPVGAAFGAQIRRDRIDDTPGEATLAGNVANFTTSGITAGRAVSKEIFGEISVPLVEGAPLIERLTLSGTARYTHVAATRRDGARDSFGDTTWKAGVDWAVTDWLRLRGTWGTSFRAPALFELFLENQTGFLGQSDVDPCIQTAARLQAGAISQRVFDNCAADGIGPSFAGGLAPVTIASGGGLGNLRPERSTAKTASIVLTPKGGPWSGLKTRLAVDYFDIALRDEIALLGAGNIVRGCYDSAFFPDEPLCGLFTRTPTGGPDAQSIAAVADRYVNISRQRNRGVDVSLAADQDLGRLGSLAFRAQMTWQIADEVALFPGTVIDDNGKIGNPKWVGDFSLRWTKGPWTLLYGLDVTGAASNRADLFAAQGGDACRTAVFRPGGRFCADVSVPATFYHALSVSRAVADRFRITLGIANLFDTPPPRVSTVVAGTPVMIGQAPAFGTQYDYLGRRVFLTVRAGL